MAAARTGGTKEIAQNRKAFHDYFILDRFEAGIELFGTEVKSVRNGNVNLKDSFCFIKNYCRDVFDVIFIICLIETFYDVCLHFYFLSFFPLMILLYQKPG